MRRSYGSLTRLFCACFFFVAPHIAHAATMTPYTSFGGGDGWLSPGEGGYTFLGTGNNERGIAYNPSSGNLLLVSRSGGTNVRRLDAATGADLGSPLDVTGVSGGTFAVSAAAVGADGVIYVTNLTTNSGTSAYKVYRWANEGAAPTVAYSGDAGLSGARAGDDLAVNGSGSSTLLAAGYNSTPSIAGNNGYVVVDPTAGTATRVAFAGTPPNAGDFRFGITFLDSSHVIGTPAATLRYTSFSGTTGTLIASPSIPDPAGNTADRLLAYTVLGGMPILAVQSTGDSHVSIYDMTDPTAPVWLASGNNTSGTLSANANGVGQLSWGAVTSNLDGTISQVLYAMSTNQGIQAFVVTIPEPGTLLLLVVSLGIGWTFARRGRGNA